MAKILIYIREPLLKGKVLRALLTTGYKFIEALTMEEVMLKLDIFKDICLLAMEMEGDGVQDFALVKKLRNSPPYYRLKIMMMLPNPEKVWVDTAHAANIDDLLLLPFVEETFLNKLRAIIGPPPNEGEIRAGNLPYSIAIPMMGIDFMQRELKAASRGNYSISLIMGRIILHNEIDMGGICTRIRDTLRETDIILKCDKDGFIILCPFTPKRHLPIVEVKCKQVFDEFLEECSIRPRLHIYGVTYPDDSEILEELLQKLEEGIHASMNLNPLKKPFDPLSWQKVKKYENTLRLKRW